ncbi:MAG: helix-turn-helix domain-containing protein [Pseudomonadota bacterium]
MKLKLEDLQDTFGERVSKKELAKYKDMPIECLVLNERESKFCSDLDLKTVGSLAAIPIQQAILRKNLWYKSVENLVEKLSNFIDTWEETQKDIMATPLDQLLEKMAKEVPQKERVFFVRRFINGETLSQIGNDYGLTREAVRQKLAKAARSLQTPNWVRLMDEYVKKSVVPKLESNSKPVTRRTVGAQVSRAFTTDQLRAFLTFNVIENFYFLDDNSHEAKLVKLARESLARRIEGKAFDSTNRRVFKSHDIGKKIRSLRRAKGLTQQEMAERIGCARITLNLWERDKITPKEDNIRRIAKALGMNVRTLLESEA